MESLDEALQDALGARYVVRREVASGGSSRVFEVWDRKLNRVVAVKVTDDPRRQPEARSEAEILAGLRHPSIVPLYEADEGPGFVYFIMPFVRGRSVRDLLKRGDRPRRAVALGWLRDVARALDYAHERGVCHGDVKPGNVLVDSGRASLADFGIARVMQWEEPDPDIQARRGTLPYMSPEQFSSPPTLGAPADVYGLACMAFELLTGEVPFAARQAPAVLAKKLRGGEAVGEGLRRLPRSAQAVLTEALDPDPRRRPPSATALIDGLVTPERRRTPVVVGFAGIALAAIATALWLRPSDVSADRVVVGPIRLSTADTAYAALPGAVVDHLTRGLQSAGFLQVVPTETALGAVAFMEASGVSDPIGTLAAEVGATVVVSGEVLVDSERLGLRLSITDARRESALASPDPVFVQRTDDGDPIRRLLEQAASGVLGALALASDQRAGTLIGIGDPPSYPAYQAFSEALDLYVAGDFERAIAGFEAAFERDTTFLAPLLYAAVSHSNRGRFAIEDSLLALVEDRTDARLTTVDRRWVDYRRAVLRGDHPAALAAIRAAAEAAPGSKAVYNLGVAAMEGRRLRDAVAVLGSLPPDRGPTRGNVNHLGALTVCLHLLGEHSEALSSAQTTREVFPDLLRPREWEAGALIALGRLDEASTRLETVATLQPDAAGYQPALVLAAGAREAAAHGHGELSQRLWSRVLDVTVSNASIRELNPPLLLHVGEAYLALGRLEQASELGQAIDSMPLTGLAQLSFLALRGRIAARMGELASAEAILDRLESIDQPYTFGIEHRSAAMVATALGDLDRAYRNLTQGFGEGLPYGAWTHDHPAFDGVRTEARFQTLLQPVN